LSGGSERFFAKNAAFYKNFDKTRLSAKFPMTFAVYPFAWRFSPFQAKNARNAQLLMPRGKSPEAFRGYTHGA
jgi:hypothetical protein